MVGELCAAEDTPLFKKQEYYFDALFLKPEAGGVLRRLYNRKSSKCLNYDPNSAHGEIMLTECAHSAGFKWSLDPKGRFVSDVDSNKCLTIQEQTPFELHMSPCNDKLTQQWNFYVPPTAARKLWSRQSGKSPRVVHEF